MCKTLLASIFLAFHVSGWGTRYGSQEEEVAEETARAAMNIDAHRKQSRRHRFRRLQCLLTSFQTVKRYTFSRLEHLWRGGEAQTRL